MSNSITPTPLATAYQELVCSFVPENLGLFINHEETEQYFTSHPHGPKEAAIELLTFERMFHECLNSDTHLLCQFMITPAFRTSVLQVYYTSKASGVPLSEYGPQLRETLSSIDPFLRDSVWRSMENAIAARGASA